ncbi:MAG: GC-type dockerin domain-anchored protein [Phycisphaerales bacterium JB059]
MTVNGAQVEADPIGSLALRLTGTDSIESNAMLARASSGQIVSFTFRARWEGAEAGESLLAQYRDASGVWQTAAQIVSDGAPESDYALGEFVIEEADLTNQLAIRFVATGSDASDVWYVDDVDVSEFQGASLPLADDFETGLLLATRWAEVEGASVTTGGAGGSLAMSLDAGQSVLTQTVDAAVYPESVFLSFRVRGESEGDTLRLEYRNIAGDFAPLATIDGSEASTLQPRVIELPFLALHSDLAIRLVADAGGWTVDDVLLALEPAPADCPADLAEPFGTLDFADVLAFLSAFGAQTAEADLSEPFGTFDFADVLAFLSSFSAGCP